MTITYYLSRNNLGDIVKKCIRSNLVRDVPFRCQCPNYIWILSKEFSHNYTPKHCRKCAKRSHFTSVQNFYILTRSSNLMCVYVFQRFRHPGKWRGKKSGGLKTIYTLMLNGILVNADGMLGGCSIRSAARKEHHHFCNCYTQNVQLLCGFWQNKVLVGIVQLPPAMLKSGRSH